MTVAAVWLKVEGIPMALLPVLLMVFLAIGSWVAFAFVRYRYCIQQELLAVLVATARQGLPLPTSMRAFAADRPEPRLNRAWTHLLLCLLLPGLNICHLRRNYRRKVVFVADDLEKGALLSHAIQRRRGVASPEMTLAAAVGEATGRLPETLERAYLLRSRFETLGTALALNFVYPMVLAVIGDGILTFERIAIAPFFEEVIEGALADSEVPMPWLYQLGQQAAGWLDVVALLFVVGFYIAVAAQSSSLLRWYLPGIAGNHRARIRAQVLEMLAFLLEVNRPVPESLEVVAGATGDRIARRRLKKAMRYAHQGEPFAACLRKARLISDAVAPLFDSAERSGHLPWAVRQWGEHLHRQLERRFHRWVNLACPIIVVVIGALFGLACVGLFYPLIEVIDQVSQAAFFQY